MRIITLNCNGIRAAARKGLFNWLATVDADIVCLQETKAQIDQLTDPIFHPDNFHSYYFDADKKGYAGTALYCRAKPLKITKGLGFEIADSEGRYLQADFNGLSVASLYLPSGSAGEERQARKLAFMGQYMQHMEMLRKDDRNILFAEIGISVIKKSILKTGRPIKRIRDFFQRSGNGWMSCTTNWDSSMRFAW